MLRLMYITVLVIPLGYTTNNSLNFLDCISTLFENFVCPIHSFVRPLSIVLDEKNYMEDHVLPTFINNLSHPICVLNDISSIARTAKIHNYAVAINDVEDLVKTFKHMKYIEVYWDDQVRFFILVLNFKGDIKSFVKEIVNIIQFQNVNAIMVISDNVDFYVYILKSTWNKDKLFFCNSAKVTKIIQNKPTKKYKAIYNNMDRCFIKKTNGNLLQYDYFNNKGLTFSKLSILAEMLDLNIILTESTDEPGAILPNGTITGDLKSLYDNQYDFLLGGYTIAIEKNLKFYYTFPILYRKLIFFVPSQLNKKFKGLSKITDVQTSIVLFLLIFLIGFVIYCTEKLLNRSMTFAKEVFMIYCFIIGASLKPPRHSSLRVFILFIILLNFFINAFFFTMLTSNLLTEISSEKFKDEQNILDSNLTLFAYPSFIAYLKTPRILSKIQPCYNNIQKCITSIIQSKKTAFIHGVIKESCFLDKYVKKDKKYLLHSILSKNSLIPTAIYMRHGFPFYKNFTEKLLLINDFGFIRKFLMDIDDQELKGIMGTSYIGLEHLKSLFEILLLLYCFYILVFIIERFLYSCRYKNRLTVF